jgi:hypothetical protein
MFSQPAAQPEQTHAEKQEELRKLRRLQMVLNMSLSVLRQDPDLTLEQAGHLIAACKSATLAMFPDKEPVFDLIYAPRLNRALAERFKHIE